jgi:hypothetical protein
VVFSSFSADCRSYGQRHNNCGKTGDSRDRLGLQLPSKGEDEREPGQPSKRHGKDEQLGSPRRLTGDIPVHPRVTREQPRLDGGIKLLELLVAASVVGVGADESAIQHAPPAR